MTNSQSLQYYSKKLTLLNINEKSYINDELTSVFKYFHKVKNSSYKDAFIQYQKNYDVEKSFFDIVIIDIDQSLCNEIELIQKIIKLNPRQQIIVALNESDSSNLVQLINIGISHFLFKPISKISMVNIVLKVSKITFNENLTTSYQEQLELSIKEKIKELEDKKHYMLQQSKFAAMGELISMIAHQWKQPLNVLSLNIASLDMMLLTKKYTTKDLEYIVSNSNKTIEYMSQTIYDFTTFLNPKENTENTITIDQLFDQSRSIVSSDIKKYRIDLNISFDLDPKSKISVNLSNFTQVLINIFKNSIDEFKSKDIKDPYINIEIYKQNNKYVIKISDNAGGIPQDILKTIFEPYVSTKGKNGTGLGMYICKLIIEGHLKGDIDVKNYKDGALFTIKFPVV